MKQIKNRYTEEIIYESKIATTIKECVEEAVKKKANLSRANLSEANLYKANLYKANLSGANLSGANLYKANLLFVKMDERVFKQITEEWFEWKITDD